MIEEESIHGELLASRERGLLPNVASSRLVSSSRWCLYLLGQHFEYAPGIDSGDSAPHPEKAERCSSQKYTTNAAKIQVVKELFRTITPMSQSGIIHEHFGGSAGEIIQAGRRSR